MKKTLLVSFSFLCIAVATVFTSCNSGGSASIYKTWYFSRITVSDSAAKANPFLAMAQSMMSSTIKSFSYEFTHDNQMKIYQDKNLVSSGKYELIGNNAIKCALAGDSAATYKMQLTDTSLSLTNDIGMSLHFTSSNK